MNRTLATGLVALLLLGVGRVHVSALAASRIALSSQALTRYSTTHSLVDLGAAVDALDGTMDIDSPTSGEFIPTRRALTHAFANVLKQIEGAYDPTFDGTDPKNVVLPMCASHPRSAQALGCVPPEQVADPLERAQYIQETKELDAKRAKVDRFTAVHQLDDLAMAGLAVTLKYLNKIAPPRVGADVAALDAIIASAGVSDARRKKIDAMMYDGMKR